MVCAICFGTGELLLHYHPELALCALPAGGSRYLLLLLGSGALGAFQNRRIPTTRPLDWSPMTLPDDPWADHGTFLGFVDGANDPWADDSDEALLAKYPPSTEALATAIFAGLIDDGFVLDDPWATGRHEPSASYEEGEA